MNSLESLGLESLIKEKLDELSKQAERRISMANNSDMSMLATGQRDAFRIVQASIGNWIAQAQKYSRSK